jgi:adenosine deaminase
LAAHPVRALFEAGIVLTLASDDPMFFGANLVDEYANLRALGFADRELVAIARAGFDAAFLSADERAPWLRALEAASAHPAGTQHE